MDKKQNKTVFEIIIILLRAVFLGHHYPINGKWYLAFPFLYACHEDTITFVKQSIYNTCWTIIFRKF